MKLIEVLNSDVRNPGVEEEIQAWLHKLPCFNTDAYAGEEISISDVETAMWNYLAKYDLSVAGMFMSKPAAPTRYYSCTVWRDNGREVVMSLYGKTIYELFAKVALLCYAKRPRE